MTDDLQTQFSEAALELGYQLDRAQDIIRGRKLGTSALVQVAEGEHQYEVGFDKIQGKWQFYYAENGMRKPMNSAPVLARIALANNLPVLWLRILENYKAKSVEITKAAAKVDEFCTALEES